MLVVTLYCFPIMDNHMLVMKIEAAAANEAMSFGAEVRENVGSVKIGVLTFFACAFAGSSLAT